MPTLKALKQQTPEPVCHAIGHTGFLLPIRYNHTIRDAADIISNEHFALILCNYDRYILKTYLFSVVSVGMNRDDRNIWAKQREI